MPLLLSPNDNADGDDDFNLDDIDIHMSNINSSMHWWNAWMMDVFGDVNVVDGLGEREDAK